jgi:4-nitrophenyl phosphatase
LQPTEREPRERLGGKILILFTIPRVGGIVADSANEAACLALAQADGILLDWDGCVAVGNRPSQAAVRFMRANRERVAIVSNNSTHRAEDFAQILAREGVTIPPRRILLAGAEALSRAQEARAARVMIIGDSRMKALARNKGLNLVNDEAGLVVLLRDPRFTYAKLERAANTLRAGARLIVSNPDLIHPSAKGRVVPETGALLAAITACLGALPLEMEVVGKPSPQLFDKACQALGVSPRQAVMIGDNPATDGAGAEALGLPWVMVGGESKLTFDHLLPSRPEPR